MFKTLHTSVFPLVKEKYSSSVRFIFRQQIQPWHPSSTLVHEAGAAVLRLSPAKFFEFSATLFEHQKDYFDVNVVNESRNETYERLARLASTTGVDEGQMMDLLKVPNKPGEDGSLNVGNGVTNDVKLMVKVRKLISYSVGYALTKAEGKSIDRCPCNTDCALQCKYDLRSRLQSATDRFFLQRVLSKEVYRAASLHSNGKSGWRKISSKMVVLPP